MIRLLFQTLMIVALEVVRVLLRGEGRRLPTGDHQIATIHEGGITLPQDGVGPPRRLDMRIDTTAIVPIRGIVVRVLVVIGEGSVALCLSTTAGGRGIDTTHRRDEMGGGCLLVRPAVVGTAGGMEVEAGATAGARHHRCDEIAGVDTALVGDSRFLVPIEWN